MSRRIAVQEADFDAGAELARLTSPAAGGVASFIGVVRADAGDTPKQLVALTLEHYPGMTEQAMTRIAEAAERRWPLLGLTMIHRFGRLLPGDTIVLVAAASPHRAAALEATAFLIDWLKTQAPFWKAEEFADGRRDWVAARAADAARAAGWVED